MGVDFPNVLKTDPNFPDILKMGRLQFSKCLQSWFFKISRFRPRRKFPLESKGIYLDRTVVPNMKLKRILISSERLAGSGQRGKKV